MNPVPCRTDYKEHILARPQKASAYFASCYRIFQNELSLLPVMNRSNEEVDEPGEGVLVHGVDIGQFCDGEEKYGRVDSDWFVPCSRLFNLDLGFLGNLQGEDHI